MWEFLLVSAGGCTFTSCQPGQLGAVLTSCYQDTPIMTEWQIATLDLWKPWLLVPTNLLLIVRGQVPGAG